MDIEEICRPIKEDLQKVELEFKSMLRSDIFLIDDVIQYVVTHKGKRLRPILLLLSCGLNGQATPQSIKAATVVELLHTATLIHDDVVDNSPLRRGVPSVNSIWQNKISVLIGDYLFSKALRGMLELESLEIINILSKVTQRMSQGELLQIERSCDYLMDEDIYFQLISDKTASLISASCRLGALTSSQGPDAINKLSAFGEYLGIAFQIKDDLLDFIGEESHMGKPIGKDIIENKITLPLLYSLKNSHQSKAKEILDLIQKGISKDEMEQVIAFVLENGGIAYATQKAHYYSQKAVNCLERFQDSPHKASLLRLVDFVTEREK